ncbi:MAG: HhH-GPD family protein [Bacteroidota bacterium]
MKPASLSKNTSARSGSAIHRSVLQWYRLYRRPLPWRSTRNPYRILLSEIMLQQTQADRVTKFYSRWLKKFPSFRSLARAPVSDVLREWSGLGYNSRALRFHRLASIVVTDYASQLPSDTALLQSLPGIGRYTSHAVACFAFGQPVPVVDVNIRRILTRITRTVRDPGAMLSEHDAWMSADRILPRDSVYDWNQALMDLGAMICTARQPLCRQCPLKTYCPSAEAPAFLRIPKRVKKKEPSRRGIPRRLYRGKILKMLHDRRYTLEYIASRLWKTHTSTDRDWLAGVLTVLCREGLLRKVRNTYRIA